MLGPVAACGLLPSCAERGLLFVRVLELLVAVASLGAETGSLRLGFSRQWHPTPVLWPGESHGGRSLVGCCLWGRTESDTTEVT